MKKASNTSREVTRLKGLVARATRVLFHEDLADYHGHVSARVPGTRTLLIKPFLTSLDKVQSRHILSLDMDDYLAFKGSPQAGSRPFRKEVKLAPRETLLHLAVYEARPDVFSVVHTHQTLASAFGIAGVPLVPVFFGGARYAPKTPILENPRIIDSIEMAREAAGALGQSNALLMRHHGVVIVGKTVEEATAGAVYLERNAYLQIIATLLGNAAPMPEQFTAEHASNMDKRAPVSFTYFESLFSKKKG
jgi:ribulose-5-phosphate 4-epimerase/fuculose-1-phosphate aldolase